MKGTRAYIMKKKEQQEKQGKVVKASSKYTGRKRRIKW
jgi:18S rRNA (guanine1575-N7)-methyltransferase